MPSLLRGFANGAAKSRSLLFDYRQQGEAIWSVFGAGREGTLWFYHSLISLYHQTDLMVEELTRVIGELEQLEKVRC